MAYVTKDMTLLAQPGTSTRLFWYNSADAKTAINNTYFSYDAGNSFPQKGDAIIVNCSDGVLVKKVSAVTSNKLVLV